MRKYKGDGGAHELVECVAEPEDKVVALYVNDYQCLARFLQQMAGWFARRPQDEIEVEVEAVLRVRGRDGVVAEYRWGAGAGAGEGL